MHCPTDTCSIQYAGCWWFGAYLIPRHLQPSWWHRPTTRHCVLSFNMYFRVWQFMPWMCAYHTEMDMTQQMDTDCHITSGWLHIECKWMDSTISFCNSLWLFLNTNFKLIDLGYLIIDNRILLSNFDSLKGRGVERVADAGLVVSMRDSLLYIIWGKGIRF